MRSHVREYETACVACGTRRAREVIRYTRNGDVSTLVRCVGCGLTRRDPIPMERDMVAFHDGGEWWFKIDEERVELFDEVLDVLGRYQPSGCLLDVGCGLGTFLARARSRGYAVTGVELSSDGCRRARERFGLDIRHGTVSGVGFADESFDVVVSNDVIYYPPDPVVEMVEYGRILPDGGMLVLELRCNRWVWWVSLLRVALHGKPLKLRGTWLSQQFEDWFALTTNYQFTSATIRRCIERAGFEVLEIRNLRRGWSANRGWRAGLFSLYRTGCNTLERLTRGRWAIGPTVIIVARRRPRVGNPAGRSKSATGAA